MLIKFITKEVLYEKQKTHQNNIGDFIGANTSIGNGTRNGSNRFG